MLIRPLTPDDMDAAAGLINLDSSEPISGDDLRRRVEKYAAHLPYLREGAFEKDQLVGYASVIVFENAVGGTHYLRLNIHPDHRGRGIGQALAERMEAHCAQHPAVPVLKCAVRDSDERSLAFAAQRGMTFSQHLFESECDLTQFDQNHHPAPHADVTITTLAELGMSEENLREFHRVTHISDRDAPLSEEWGVMTWEDFEGDVLKASWFRPEGAIVAFCNGEWAGVHTVGPSADPLIATTDYTGVLREFRGKGIGMSVKVAGLAYAKSIGCERAITHNDSTNEPMLRINYALGFKPQPGYMYFRRVNA